MTDEDTNASDNAGRCGFLCNDLRRDGANVNLQDCEEAWPAKKHQKVAKRKGIL